MPPTAKSQNTSRFRHTVLRGDVVMAETVGLVQQLNVTSSTTTCAWIGPTPNNTALLAVTNDGSAADVAFAANLVEILAAAATNYRVVAAAHADDDSKITSIRVDPV